MNCGTTCASISEESYFPLGSRWSISSLRRLPSRSNVGPLVDGDRLPDLHNPRHPQGGEGRLRPSIPGLWRSYIVPTRFPLSLANPVARAYSPAESTSRTFIPAAWSSFLTIGSSCRSSGKIMDYLWHNHTAGSHAIDHREVSPTLTASDERTQLYRRDARSSIVINHGEGEGAFGKAGCYTG